MKKLIICLLITLTGLLGQNAVAQSEKPTLTLPSSSGFVTLTYSNGDTKTGTELGVTKATQILKDICGVVKTDGTWGYEKKGKSYIAPSTTPGDVYFVEVNDFWMGVNSTSVNTLYDQINKGVKEITKVDTDSKKTTTTGTFYTHPAENVNKFFFIVRRSGTSPREEGTDYDRAFGWYDEWSYAKPYSTGWWGQENYYTGKDGYNHLEATWTTLMDGAPFPSPHNCTSSLETNHYIALDGKNPADREGHDFTAYLYVPKNTSSYDPYVFFYAIKLNDVPDSDVNEKEDGTYDETKVNPYNVTLHWTTAFDKYKDVDVQKPTKYDGMRERYIIERSYDNTKWEIVTAAEHLDEDNVKNVTLKTYTDTSLKPFDEETAKFGYTVYYRITSVVEKLVDEDGKAIDPTRMSSTTSDFVTVVIPGSVPFKLTLDGVGTSVYDPVTNMNSFTNVIVSSDSKVDATIALTEGTKLGLYKVEKDAYNKDVITGEPYISTVVSAADVTNNVTLKDLANRLDNTDDGVQNGHFRHTMVVAGGDDNTAAYQLMMTLPNADADAIYSNVLRINNPKLQAAAVKAHRSGCPDHETCKDDNGGKEVFHNEITFAASTKTTGSGYHIYRDATEADKEPIMTLLYSPTGEGVDRFRVTKPAPAEGEADVYYYPTDGMISITDLHEQSPIAIGETGELNDGGNNAPAAWGYSVAAYDVNGNTYGSQLATAIYNGEIGELALDITATKLKAAVVKASNDIYVQAAVTWNLTKQQYADANPADDNAFDIYVSITDTHGDDADAVSTLSNDEGGFVKLADLALSSSETTYTFTDLYTSKYQKEIAKFKTPDELLAHLKTYKFYVKMRNAAGEVKNSAVYTPTPDAGANGIYTALGNIEAADMDVKVVNGVVEVNGVTGAIKVVNAAGALVAEAEGNGDVTEIAGLTTGVYVVTAPNVKPTKILIK